MAQVSPIGAGQRTVAKGFAFTEAPRWRDGALWFSDFFTHAVYRVAPGAEVVRVCAVPGRPSGLGFDPDGRLLVVSMTDRRILRLQAGELVEHVDLSAIAPADLNDMVVSDNGDIYVGNFGRNAALNEAVPPTRLIHVTPDGTARFVGEPLYDPNGCVIADAGNTLLVAETLAARISAFTIERNGDLTHHRVWAQLGPAPDPPSLAAALAGPGPVPDGIALDAEGALWVADASGGALRVAPGGDTLDAVDVPGMCVYAVALGGSDMRTLYLCVAPSLARYDPVTERRAAVIACEVPIPGSAAR